MSTSVVWAALVGAVGALSAAITNWWAGRRTTDATADATAVATALEVMRDLRVELDRKGRRIDALEAEVQRERRERRAGEVRCEARVDRLLAEMRRHGIAAPEGDG